MAMRKTKRDDEEVVEIEAFPEGLQIPRNCRLGVNLGDLIKEATDDTGAKNKSRKRSLIR